MVACTRRHSDCEEVKVVAVPAARESQRQTLKARAVAFAEAVGAEEALHALARRRASLPQTLVNFIFQRVIGINRDVPWPVHFTSRVTNPRRIRIHPSVRRSLAVSGGCYVQGGHRYRDWGGHAVRSRGGDHLGRSRPERFVRTCPPAPVRIGRGCWIGANAVILPGALLGDGVIVGAGAVVTGEYPDACVVGGVPTRALRMRQL